VRVRPRGWVLEPGLKVRHATWGMEKKTPGNGSLTTVALSVKNMPSGALGGMGGDESPASPLLWAVTAEWNQEEAVPEASAGDGKSWWRIYFKIGI